jgi:hypothetical protein
MNCRFCGTIVPAPPSECPKCGRPVSLADVSRNIDQIAAATVVYRREATQRRNPKWMIIGILALAFVITALLIGYSRYSKSATVDQSASVVAPKPQAPSQQSERPSAQSIEPQSAASSRLNVPDPLAAVKETVEEPVSTGPDLNELVEKAHAAFSRGDWIQPSHDNALKWARDARRFGSKQGERLEEQVYIKMMQSVENSRQARDYPAAIEKINEMIPLFPRHTSLPTLKASIQKEQRSTSTQ